MQRVWSMTLIHFGPPSPAAKVRTSKVSSTSGSADDPVLIPAPLRRALRGRAHTEVGAHNRAEFLDRPVSYPVADARPFAAPSDHASARQAAQVLRRVGDRYTRELRERADRKLARLVEDADQAEARR